MAAEIELCLLTRGIGEFTKHLNMKLRTQNRKLKKHNDNEIFSPIGIHSFLVLLSQDPCLHNKDFFSATLHVDINVAIAGYKDIFATFDSVSDLLNGNTSFLKNQTMMEAVFKNVLKDNFFSNINFLNFTEQEGVNEIIHAYVKNKTVHKITHFSGVKDGTNFTFLNAMHFQNVWSDPFALLDTVPEMFLLNVENKIEVQMMKRKGEFYYKYSPTLHAKILKLPLANSNISLIVVLPESETNLNQILSHDLTLLTNNMTKEEVDVSLPKFKMNETLQLADSLKGTDLEEIFSVKLPGIIEGEILDFNGMEQKVCLEVNEKGLEMATSTLSTLTNALDEKLPPKNGLIIYEANISTEISNRFAKTDVVWRVHNSNERAANAEFKVVLTETAFISAFSMEIEGTTHKSYIKEKETAKNVFMGAVAQGQSAGLVEAKTRDSKEFVVSVNLEAGSVAVFSLTYEEMLQRVHDQYELVLNICPGQIIDDLNVEVRINESRPLKFVKTPPLRSGDNIRTNAKFDKHLEPCSNIKIINSKTACVKFRPDSAVQKRMTHYLGNKVWEGLSGQFVVQYDVEREQCNGEVLLQDGYFVHFFAPNDLEPLPKHVIFVLDTSSSMMGRKLEQLKDAMTNIIDGLKKEDTFHLMEFNDYVIVWDINFKKFTMLSPYMIQNFKEPFLSLQRHFLPSPQYASDTVIQKAKEVVQEMKVCGRTFAIGGLETALYLATEGQKLDESKDEKVHPIIIFLTDGEPNEGIYSKDEIVDVMTQLNTNTKLPIFSLSFGKEADRNFLRKLSLKNFAFSRHIYEAADASLQLQDFYKMISSPLLHNINFKYDREVTEVTRTWFPLYFRGSELVVSGRYGGSTFPTVIDCWGPHGLISVNSSAERPVTSLERLWAYLTVKQLLDARDTTPNVAELTRKATDIALKYSFVTDVTSLVVVKPNDTTLTCDHSWTNSAPQQKFKGPKDILGLFKAAHTSQSNFVSSKAAGESFGVAPSSQPKFGSPMAAGRLFGAAPSSQPSFGGPHASQQRLKKLEGRAVRFGAKNITTSFTFGCPQDTQTSGTAPFSQSGAPSFTFGCPPDKKSKLEKKEVKIFRANRPFIIMLQLEKDDTTLILFQGYVCRPSY
ncbi:inter-alpha-trypsin inhibitor heavy chain H3 [Anoplophora glabripennis]|nr:inter-alpha-trypsin inhibitor heavy chain H3 [Anoplophora glabripennis]